MIPIPTFIYKYLAMAAVVLALVIGAGYKGYHMGADNEKAVHAALLAKANAEVVKKNEELQALADKQAEVQVVYKDKIVTQYKTITKDVITYVQTPAASVGLDPEFVRLHNDAARLHDSLQIADASSGPDGQAGPVGVTTGEAIGVIARNYEQYQQCRRQVIGWQSFYEDLSGQVNK